MPAEDKYELFTVRPAVGVTAISSLGVALTVTGTAAARTPASTGWLDSQNRVGIITAAGAGSVAGINDTALMHFLGNASNRGGFLFIQRFGLPTVVADERYFFGFRASVAAPTDVDPSTLTDVIGIGVDGTDANLQVMHNDAAGAATKVNLGASFPPRTAGVAYELVLECLRNATVVNYSVRRLDVVGTPARGVLSSNLPLNTAFLGRYGFISNNATASAIAFDLMSTTSGNPMFESFL
jgi:hypothetical protein